MVRAWEPDESLLQEILRLVRRGAAPALFVALVAAGLVYYLSHQRDPVYEAQATVLATQVDPDLRSFGVSLVTASPLGASAYRAAATSTPVLAGALTSLGATTADESDVQSLRSDVSVGTEVESETTLVHIYVQAGSPEVAALRADAIVNAFLAWDTARAQENLDLVVDTLENQVRSLSAQIEALDPASPDFENQRTGLASLRAQQQTQLTSALALRSSAVGLLEVLEPPSVPSEPIRPRPARSAALAFLVALSLVYGVVALRDALNTRLRSSDDLARATGLPVLAAFSKQPRNVRRLPDEALSYLRTNLLFTTTDDRSKVFLVAGARVGEGRTQVAMGLAESFARNGHRTLLIDANLRDPAIAGAYEFEAAPTDTLNAHLTEPTVVFKPVQVLVALKQRLDVLPAVAASSSPIEMLSRRFRDCLNTWREEYEVIVIDSAPLLEFADALTIAPFCTGTVLVANQKIAHRRDLRAAMELLERLEVRILGAVMTGASEADPGRTGSAANNPSRAARRTA